jgi:hypothetical protein
MPTIIGCGNVMTTTFWSLSEAYCGCAGAQMAERLDDLAAEQHREVICLQ